VSRRMVGAVRLWQSLGKYWGAVGGILRKHGKIRSKTHQLLSKIIEGNLGRTPASSCMVPWRGRMHAGERFGLTLLVDGVLRMLQSNKHS